MGIKAGALEDCEHQGQVLISMYLTFNKEIPVSRAGISIVNDVDVSLIGVCSSV